MIASTKFLFGEDLAKQMRDVKETHPLSDIIGIHIPPNESTSIWAVLNRLGRIFRERSTANQPQKVPLPENRQPSREEIMLSLEQIKLSMSDFTNFVANSLRGYRKGRCDNFRAGCVSFQIPYKPESN